MKLAVLTYEFIENKPDNMPINWPAEVKELEDDASLPGENWVAMTLDEFNNYKETYKTEYDSYQENSTDDPISLAARKVEFGVDLVQRCIIKLGVLDLSSDAIVSMLQTLMPIKQLLEAGALATSKILLQDALPNFIDYPDHTSILQYAIDQIIEFGY